MTVGLIRSMIKPGGGVKHIRRYKSWTEEVWERYERITGKPRPEFFRTKKDGANGITAKESFAKDGEADGYE